MGYLYLITSLPFTAGDFGQIVDIILLMIFRKWNYEYSEVILKFSRIYSCPRLCTKKINRSNWNYLLHKKNFKILSRIAFNQTTIYDKCKQWRRQTFVRVHARAKLSNRHFGSRGKWFLLSSTLYMYVAYVAYVAINYKLLVNYTRTWFSKWISLANTKLL